MTTSSSSKAQPNDHGITWAPSKSGKAQVALRQMPHKFDRGDWMVWAVYTGTHDMAISRSFTNEQEARKFANWVWRTY